MKLGRPSHAIFALAPLDLLCFSPDAGPVVIDLFAVFAGKAAQALTGPCSLSLGDRQRC
jgi:hypothetical protein